MENNLNLKQKFLSLRTLFSFLAAFFIIYLLITRMDLARVLAVIKNINVSLYILGFLVYYLAFPLRGARFRTMLGNSGCKGSAPELTRIIFISWFANCVAPAKLGDIFRAYLVKRRYCHGFVNTVGTIFAERVFDLFILYLLIGLSGLMAFHGRIPPTMMVVLETSFVILAVVLAVLVFLRFAGIRLAGRLPERFQGMYERFLSGTMSSFHHNGQIAGITAVIWFLEGASFFLAAKSVGINLTFVELVFVGLTSALLTALPITPAGLGVVETAKVGMLMFFGIDRNVALSAALVDRLINYWSILLVGFAVYMITEHSTKTGEVSSDESDDNHSYVQ